MLSLESLWIISNLRDNIESFSLVIRYLLELVLRKSLKASLVLVLNAEIAVAVSEAGGDWIVVIL